MNMPIQVHNQGAAADTALTGIPPVQQPGTEALPAGTAPLPAPIQPAPIQPAGEDTWEQRYKVLQGKYNAEVGNVRKANDFLATKMAEQAAQISNLSSQPVQPAQPAQAAQPAIDPTNFDMSKFVSAEDLARLDQQGIGNDEMGIIARTSVKIAQAMIASQGGGPSADTQQLKNDVNEIKEKAFADKKAVFDSELLKAVSDWQAINTDQRWLHFLTLRQPGTSVARQHNLNIAGQKLDHVAAIEQFNDFKAAYQLPIAPVEGQALPPQAQHIQPRLDQNIDPIQINPNQQLAYQPGSQGTIYTKAMVNEFYKDWGIGNKYTEDQAKAIDLDIQNAALQGRIQP